MANAVLSCPNPPQHPQSYPVLSHHDTTPTLSQTSPPHPPPTSHQEAGTLLSRVCSIDTSDTDSAYNAACAFALAGDASSCFQALSEFCRRLAATVTASAVDGGGASSGKRNSARLSLREAGGDADLEGVRGASWFADLLSRTDAALAGGA